MCITEKNKVITYPSEVANSFNNYFSNVAQNILTERKYEGIGDFQKFLPHSQPNTTIIDPVDGDEIISIINKINLK